ncbi:hypothetical protein [Streptomyces klenkii]|uniref:hypothetical protein n=1 Tax=Streptomyces klenkii TaxID=1420899 RepID=UPI00341520ED
MHDIVSDSGPLIPEDLRASFQAEFEDLEKRGAFEEVIEALRPDEEAGEHVEKLEASLRRVGLIGAQLSLKLSVIDWAEERALSAFQRAKDAGPPEVLDPEDSADFDAANPPEAGDPARRSLWRRARKLLAKLLKAIDDVFESLISAIPHVGELILEFKKALESALDR